MCSSDLAWRAVVDRYAGGPVDREALIEGAIKGMVGALNDPYSAYLSPADYKQALQDLSCQFEGVGAEIGTRKPDGTATDCSTLAADCRLTVIAPIAGSPAEKAGLKAEIEVYEGTLHGWCPPDAAVYNKDQAERAWTRLLANFKEALV